MDVVSSLQYIICKRLVARRNIYINLMNGLPIDAKFLIVGDRPGPSAPKLKDYHHTPFYSLKHCSGWLNYLLEENGISEESLVWMNAYDVNGIKFDSNKIKGLKCEIIALGSNAEKWLISNEIRSYSKSYHPQYWKRFKSKERYPLIDLLASK
jgi:hypothetical protein